MTPQHLAAANAALDELEVQGIIRGNEDGTRYTMEYNSMMTMEPPLSTPFREMLAHPAIGACLWQHAVLSDGRHSL